MSLAQTPLDPAKLSAGAQRALGAGPGKLMAARGLMPLPPAEQVTVLYQLSIDPDPAIAEAAKKTAGGLPDKLLAGTLADGNLDPRVLDLFAALHGTKPAIFDAVVTNPAVADETIATLAAKADSRAVDMIATNEQRLLRHPEIVAAMYMNRHARMSTIDRVVELAVRNQVRVPGLACWDEVARALTGTAPSGPEADAIFMAAADAASGDDTPLTTGDAEQVVSEEEANAEAPALDAKVPINEMSVPSKIRLATLGNAFARATLIRDPLRLVSMAAIKSPGVTEIEAARYAGNQSLDVDVIRYISQKREWTRLYGIKVSLCRNPKTPVAESTKMLPFLREKDITNLAKSRGVPSALVAQCRKLLLQRRGGSGK